jgi:hypothetical protein
MKMAVRTVTALLFASLPMCASPAPSDRGPADGDAGGNTSDAMADSSDAGTAADGSPTDTDGSTSSGDIIPADRSMDWTVAGIPGGIPKRTTICSTLTPGATSAEINAAIDACPPDQVVYAPAGVYPLDATIGSGSHGEVVLRGDGPGKTVFRFGGGTAVSFGSADWPPPAATTPIVSGATKKSTTITVDSTSATSGHGAFSIGGFIRLEAGQNPPYVHDLGVDKYNQNLSMTFRVTSLTPNTVTFEPPLPFDLSPYTPMVAVFAIAPLTGVGLESFTIDLQGSGGYGVALTQMWGSWMHDVEIEKSAHHVIALYTVLQSEVSHCNFHDTVATGPDTEGLDFYMYVDWNLVENNIVYKAGGINLGDWEGGNVGNVVAYNFAYATSADGSGTTAMSDIDLNHASNNILNLVEGNVVGGVVVDGYFGSASHYTIFRNWLTATHPTATNSLHAIWLKHFSDYFNVVGNVLGTSAFPTMGSVDGNGHATGGFYDAPQTSNYDDGAGTGVQTIYELGFPNMGNTDFSGTIAAKSPIDYSSQGSSLAMAQAADLNVAATLLRHANYDYFHRAIVYDAQIAQHQLPDSLVHAAKPAWFGSLAWPPFDPASPPGAFDNASLAKIPAGYRYVNGVDP